MDQFELKSPNEYYPEITISGKVIRCDKDFIYIEIFKDKDISTLEYHCKIIPFDMHFKVNALPYRIQHKTLDFFLRFNLHPLLIDNKIYNRGFNYSQSDHSLQSYNFKGELSAILNSEQQLVVSSILKMDKTHPFLLFGPAGSYIEHVLLGVLNNLCVITLFIYVQISGTGKTRTLVAVIEEIVRSSNKYVLVCANSNAACDEITLRLVKVLKKHEIFRMYAKSFNESKVDASIKQCCNYYRGRFQYPCLQYLYGFRVVVCTLLTSGHLMRARSDPNFNPKHFSYIIVDECASTNETTTLIPIAGMNFFRNFSNCNFNN